MITEQEQDEMREFARFYLREVEEDLEKMRRGDRPEEEEQVMPPSELPPEQDQMPDDMNNVPPPGRLE